MKALTGFFALSALALASMMPVPVSAGGEWKDSDCRNDKDQSGNAVQVCRAAESLGIFWNDGSYANGWCDGRAYDIDYKGISKEDALSWVKYYCG
jgi:hypothetical protein